VLGLDVGGTSSRALVTTTDGTRLGFGQAGAANPVMVPVEEAVANVTLAVKAALSEVDPRDIRCAVMGIAGTSRFASHEVSTAFANAFTDLGITCPLHPVGDVMVAFAAGSSEPVGTVLISGTGAVAAQIANGAMTKVADGFGWLLGDLGSGFWLGRSAAIATARALVRGTHSTLTQLVIGAVGYDDRDEFVSVLHARPPRDLAHLAPLVTQAALAGDATALSIVEQAASHLTDTAAEVHGPGPIVLAGSVLRHSAPVRDAVRHRLSERFPRTQIEMAGEGEAGAARLAARWLV
jgi:N-acetylglucosamine kinase-like BadF-type ATPase